MRIEALKVGPYTSGDDVDYGPVITQASKDRINGLIASGVEQGANLVVDGRNFELQWPAAWQCENALCYDQMFCEPMRANATASGTETWHVPSMGPKEPGTALVPYRGA